MNRLDTARRGEIVAALVRGAGLREAARAVGVSRMTVDKLVRNMGAVCVRYQADHLRGLACRRLDWDAVWSFVHRAGPDASGQLPRTERDVWTWVARDVDTALVPAWLVGARDVQTARAFVLDLAGRLRHGARLAIESGKPCLEAGDATGRVEIDDAVLNALYGPEAQPAAGVSPEPPAMHVCAVAIHFMHHNFGQMAPGRQATPAMLAGVADRPWRVEDLVALLEAEG